MNEEELKTKEQKLYLKGYKDGFMSSMKMSWALAEELLISVDNTDKDLVRKFIEKLKS